MHWVKDLIPKLKDPVDVQRLSGRQTLSKQTNSKKLEQVEEEVKTNQVVSKEDKLA